MHHRRSTRVKGHYRNGTWIAAHNRKDSWVTEGIRKTFNRKVHYNPPVRRSMPNNQSKKEYDRYGFDTFCYYKYTHSMYDLHGFNVYGIHRDTGTCFDIDGYNRLGEHQDDIVQVEGYNECGYDMYGYDIFNFDKTGYHKDTKTRLNKERLSKQHFQNKIYDDENYKWKQKQNENIRRYRDLKKKTTLLSQSSEDSLNHVYMDSEKKGIVESLLICSLSRDTADNIKEFLSNHADEKRVYIQINAVDFDEYIIEILNIMITKIVDMGIGVFEKNMLIIPLSNINNLEDECKCLFGFLPEEDCSQEFILLPKYKEIVEAKEKFLQAKVNDQKSTSSYDTGSIRNKLYGEFRKIGGQKSDIASRNYLIYDDENYRWKQKQNENIKRYKNIKKKRNISPSSQPSLLTSVKQYIRRKFK